jgi:hypothetical protein
MKPNTAACLALCGLSLWCWCWCGDASGKFRGHATFAAQCFALLAVFVGLATLAEYMFHSNFGIDQLLFVDRLGDGHSLPGRMAPNTALCFAVLGLALVLIPKETKGGHRPAQLISLIPAFISLMAILGYLYSAISLYRIASFTGMTVHTATAFFLLSLGVFFSVPERGLTAVISSNSSGGILLRRLLPTASLVPIVIGWLRMEGQKAGWYGTEFGLAMMVTVDVAIFVAVIYLSGAEIDRIATARHESELAMRTAQDGLLAMNYTLNRSSTHVLFPSLRSIARPASRFGIARRRKCLAGPGCKFADAPSRSSEETRTPNSVRFSNLLQVEIPSTEFKSSRYRATTVPLQ